MKTTIFTDGSSRGNPGPGGWGSVVINKENIIELGGREDNTTNNRMELTACIEALSKVKMGVEKVSEKITDKDFDLITVHTDSSYVINGITKWVKGWKANGWVTKTKDEVMNKDLWEKLIAVSNGKNISWQHVGGHSGIVGNERCDIIATSFADKTDIKLYVGPTVGYPIVNILDLTGTGEKVSKKSHSKAKAYSYISMVSGKIEIHATWDQCESRVKGKSGTRFKKAISQEQEKEIIAEFMKNVL